MSDSSKIGSVIVLAALGLGGGWWWYSTSSTQTRSKLPFGHAHDLMESCSSGEGAACLELGESLEADHAPSEEVVEKFLRACAAKNETGCKLLLDRVGKLEIAKGATQPVLAALDAECQARPGPACAFIVRASAGGEGLADPARVRRAARIGCGADAPALCTQYGDMAKRAQGGPAEPIEARKAFERACDKAQSAHACAEAAGMEARGDGGPKAPSDAADHARLACDADARECLGSALLGESLAWQAARPALLAATASGVHAREPVLFQDVDTFYESYTTPDKFETRVKERGIVFRETYLETTKISGHTYVYTRTDDSRYANASIELKNTTCAPARIELAVTFDFGAYDALKRGAGSGLLVYFLARAVGADKEASKQAALDAATTTATSGLQGSTFIVIPPGQTEVVSIEADTQSIFGRNRRMESVHVDKFSVSFPDGQNCRPAGFEDLRDLQGTNQVLRDQYATSCAKGKRKVACAYLEAIDDGNREMGLRAACNNGGEPSLSPACDRVLFLEWLHAPALRPSGSSEGEP